ARTHDPCNAPVASIATTGTSAPAHRRIVAVTSSRPGRSDGTDLGSSSNPASPVLNHTRCKTFPGSIATTSADPGNACCNSPEPVIATPPQYQRFDHAGTRGQELSATAGTHPRDPAERRTCQRPASIRCWAYKTDGEPP